MSRNSTGDAAGAARSRVGPATFGVLLWVSLGAVAIINGGPVWLGVLAAAFIVVSAVDLATSLRRRARG